MLSSSLATQECRAGLRSHLSSNKQSGLVLRSGAGRHSAATPPAVTVTWHFPPQRRHLGQEVHPGPPGPLRQPPLPADHSHPASSRQPPGPTPYQPRHLTSSSVIPTEAQHSAMVHSASVRPYASPQSPVSLGSGSVSHTQPPPRPGPPDWPTAGRGAVSQLEVASAQSAELRPPGRPGTAAHLTQSTRPASEATADTDADGRRTPRQCYKEPSGDQTGAALTCWVLVPTSPGGRGMRCRSQLPVQAGLPRFRGCPVASPWLQPGFDASSFFFRESSETFHLIAVGII